MIERTRTAFKNLPQAYKFFYLDEDNEIISINSQSDFDEALEIEEFTVVRLTVAAKASDARNQLLVQLEEQRPLAESLNSSQINSQSHPFGRSRTVIEKDAFMAAAESDFDAISHQELAQSIVDARPSLPVPLQKSHTVAVGSDDVM